ncbi:hypothetical protein E2C01_038218 [Portunus trituberculatus]|uniref:Uncharacterized protein n=1 Tax=Portunus trituberculatus TaxID=210409 RepID=A0A5B7FJD2_PORTR|nr:hypothetical protein [Portunus trituberculatus]
MRRLKELLGGSRAPPQQQATPRPCCRLPLHALTLLPHLSPRTPFSYSHTSFLTSLPVPLHLQLNHVLNFIASHAHNPYHTTPPPHHVLAHCSPNSFDDDLSLDAMSLPPSTSGGGHLTL